MRALLTMLDKDRSYSSIPCVGELRGVLHKALDTHPTDAPEGMPRALSDLWQMSTGSGRPSR